MSELFPPNMSFQRAIKDIDRTKNNLQAIGIFNLGAKKLMPAERRLHLTNISKISGNSH
jgi:hypothetical protein